MTRLAPADPGRTEVPAAVLARLGRRGRRLSPLYATLAHAPDVLVGWSELSDALRYRSSLSPLLRELVILRLGQLGRAPYVWAYHRALALEAGATEEQLLELSRWRASSGFAPELRAALAFAEAGAGGEVGAAAFAEATAGRSPQEVVELSVLVGFYAGVVRVLGTLEIEIDPDHLDQLRGFE